MIKKIINKIRKTDRKVMVEAKVLNLYTNEVETIVTDSKGFDVIETKKI